LENLTQPYIHPPKNIVSQNDIVGLWEGKIGKTLEKTYVSEEELLKNIQGDNHLNCKNSV